jgi:hypothetical protein
MTGAIREPKRSGVYRVSRPEAAPESALRIDLAGARDKAGLLSAFARALAFPDWFGGNWDALEDCLTDLSWVPGGEIVLLIQGGGSLGRDDLGILIDVLAASAGHWRARGRPFVALFAGGPAELPEWISEPET